MHPNKVFHTKSEAENIAFATARGFGILSVNGPDVPLMAHVPFIIEGSGIWLHLLRSNPIARALTEPRPAVLAVSGPDGYVSPDWYRVDDQVPTWNYVAVHLRGMLERRPDGELRSVLDRLSARFEAELTPKPPWSAEKMTPEVLQRMMRAILPCRLRIESVDGTWKLNQNKPDEVRLRAADELERAQMGADTKTLAGLMRDP